MNDDWASQSADDRCEAIAGKLLEELDRAGDHHGLIDDYARKHPDCALVIRERASDHLRLKASATGGEPPLVVGDFRLSEKLGPSMGIVYLARQLSTGLTVVLKFRRGELAGETTAHLLEEHRILARLADSGAHIVPLLTAGEQNGWHYLAMKHIKGASLREVIAAIRKASPTWPTGPPKSGLARFVTEIKQDRETRPEDMPTVVIPPPPNDTTSSDQTASPMRDRLPAGYVRAVVAAIADVADAVHAAHSLRFVHRDVKPSNVMIDSQGQAWLIDFGLALRHRRKTGSAGAPALNRGAETDRMDPTATISADWPDSNGESEQVLPFAGTPAYAAPEQLAGHPVAQSDAWGLGATLYEALSLRRPFVGGSISEIEAAHANPALPLPLRQCRRGIPRDLDAICRKAMTRDLSRRYQTAADFAADLRRWLQSEPTSLGPGWGARRCALWARRKPGWAAAGAILAIGLFAAWRTESRRWTADIARERAEGARQVAEAQTARLNAERSAALMQARVAAEARQESEIRALISAARARLRSRKGAHAEDVLNDAAREIARRIALLSEREVISQFELELRSLVLGARSEPVISARELTQLPTTPNLPWRAAIHPSGDEIAVAGPERPYRIVRGQEFERPANFKNVLPRARIWYSPRGTWVLHAPAGGGLALWDGSIESNLASWRSAGDEPGPVVLAIGFAGDGEDDEGALRSIGSDGVIRRFALPALTEDHERQQRFTQLARFLTCAAFSSDLRRLAVGDAAGNLFVVDDEGEIDRISSLGGRSVDLAAWSPDAGLLAAATKSGAILVYDLGRKEILHRLAMAEHELDCLFFSPDGRLLFGTQRGAGTTVWDVVAGEPVLIGQVSICGCSSDGLRLASADQDGVGFCDWRPPSVVASCIGHRQRVVQVAWAADSSRFASLDSSFELCLWDTDDCRLLRRVQLPARDYFGENGALALSSDGSVVCAAYSRDGAGEAFFLLADSDERRGPVPLPVAGCMRGAHLARTGRFLVACEHESHVGQHDLQTVLFEIAPELDPTPVSVLRLPAAADRGFLDHGISLDGRRYVWLGPRGPRSAYRAELWDLESRSRIETIDYSTAGEMATRDAAVLLGDSGDLWMNCEHSARESTSPSTAGLVIHRAKSLPAACSVDGQWRVYMQIDNRIRPEVLLFLFRANEERPLFHVITKKDEPAPNANSVRFSPDSKKLAWGNTNGSISLLDLTSLPAIVTETDALRGGQVSETVSKLPAPPEFAPQP